ncbi:Heavy metal-associated isoprenylated plant protein 30 [Asimina triloba]
MPSRWRNIFSHSTAYISPAPSPTITTFNSFKYGLPCLPMATALDRTLDSLLSTLDYFVYSSFRYLNYSHYNHNMPKGRPLSLQTVDLKARMCCEGCERVVRDAIMKLKGIDSVEVNLPLERVTVIGYVDPNKVLKAVRRSGKRAEFWPNPDNPLYFTTADNYFRDERNEYKASYNYWRHGYNGDKHGIMHATHRGDDKVSNMFNDDNVNACSLM